MVYNSLRKDQSYIIQDLVEMKLKLGWDHIGEGLMSIAYTSQAMKSLRNEVIGVVAWQSGVLGD